MGKKQRAVSKRDIIMSIVRNKPDDIELSHAQIEFVINAFLDEIIKRVCKGDKVVIKFFGTFKKIKCKARKYVTPTGKTGHAASANKMTFTQSVTVANKFNE